MSLLEAASPALALAPGAHWTTPAGVAVRRTVEPAGSAASVRAALESALDERRGLLLFRGHDRVIGYVDPPLEIDVRGDVLTVTALNDRGRVLLPAVRGAVAGTLLLREAGDGRVSGVAAVADGEFAEEERTRRAGVFGALRALVGALAGPDGDLLGLYGAFGYDLIFHLDPVDLRTPRAAGDRDLVLQLPDEIVDLDLRRDVAVRHAYEFTFGGRDTCGLPRGTAAVPYRPGRPAEERDHAPGEYAGVVRRAMPYFEQGELFEAVPGQVFRRPAPQSPSALFRRLRAQNPAPHSLLAHLGEGEYLVGASPEMFVDVAREDLPLGRGLMVRTSPISGTAPRGRDAFEDAARVKELLASVKEESELTMCTDVDRNDKAKVCVPGTVRVTDRRRIERYSAVIHTVDRVEGRLREDRDALDAFLAHLWAVTVTGAPKLAAVQFIEDVERSPRRWYGGAVGRVGLDGTLETVLTLRTIQLRDGVATVRAGATLLHDSDPALEERETELKARALLRALESDDLNSSDFSGSSAVDEVPEGVGAGLRVLLVDHRDSFAHCLADYLRQTGAQVTTYRAGRHLPVIERERPDLVVLSPGPGRPADFGLSDTLDLTGRLGIPVFGVCLGLQGLVEHCGGTLGTLTTPVHGKPSRVSAVDGGGRLLDGLPDTFEVGRYHSLYARPDQLPPDLRVTALTEDGVVMAVEHRSRPLAAVQFHPESIMTARGAVGRRIVANAVASLTRSAVRG
ncbi:anthranilate synthase component I [Streptomyces alanosinicus]|uniref:Anthranilate synthase component I n=1 Tax=Streptomyces alanosinicus TaxID=68171 RepID=A0A918YR41_9ACTN|nr:anthranilate synthase component I [Streptomyces alanosinicus]GHE12655.1 anthranilate synthase component I [Streptomyces alanosinicus]